MLQKKTIYGPTTKLKLVGKIDIVEALSSNNKKEFIKRIYFCWRVLNKTLTKTHSLIIQVKVLCCMKCFGFFNPTSLISTIRVDYMVSYIVLARPIR